MSEQNGTARMFYACGHGDHARCPHVVDAASDTQYVCACSCHAREAHQGASMRAYAHARLSKLDR